MSTPNPLIPQGTFQAQASKGASNVRIAVATIIAIHVVFFGGLLLQGCKRDTPTATGPETDTNSAASNLTLPPIDTGYYTSSNQLPESTSSLYTTPPPTVVETPATPSVVTPPRETFTNAFPPSGFESAPTLQTQVQTPTAGATEYTVVRGDTLAEIASAHGISLSALQSANPGVEPRRLRPGMKLQVPAPSPSSRSSQAGASGGESNGNVYTVKAGDNLTKIARQYGVTISQLRAANNLRTSSIKVGQKLKIPASARNGATNAL